MLLRKIQQLPDDFLYPPQTVFHRDEIFLLPDDGDKVPLRRL